MEAGLERMAETSEMGVSGEKGAMAAFDKEVRMEQGKGGEEIGRFVEFWSCRPGPACSSMLSSVVCPFVSPDQQAALHPG